jgi:hypothetical protein
MKLPMKHRSLRFAVVASVAALLTVAAATPGAAQQAADSGRTVEASAVQSGSASAPLPGPRLRVASFAALLTAAAAQQAAGSGATTAASAAQAGSSAPLPGPRLRPELSRVEPSIVERSATAWPMAPARNHTIVISTLALVLIAVLVTILVVK